MAGHALVVGGTGMLRGVTLDLAARGWTVSVVARRHGPLAALRQDTAARSGRPDAVNPVPVDYTDIGALAAGIRAATTVHGPVELAVCYIHSNAPHAPIVVADMVANRLSSCPYIHIVGSTDPDELRIDANRDELSQMPGLRYRRVILGFVLEGESARWLNDDEIVTGVLGSICNESPEQVIGRVSPWQLHPPL